ncbi:MAG: DUF262 domain-containing protein [Bacteroidaceae bacterium]|nr:DUF262 domain-containing protein [Bacteroidaceae bacterium]
MKHKIFYGEYTLQHWIDLMLSGNIEMPVYQRYFVWDEEMAKDLLTNIKKTLFVPPVIIGSFDDNRIKKNLILDGQQRLTSLLLARLGIFPDKKKFTATLHQYIDENDDTRDNNDEYSVLCDWTYKKLLEKSNKIDEIKANIDTSVYKTVDYKVGGNFFEEHYLGFCYLVPITDDQNAQQKYYSSVFRSINAQGVALIPQESREALYFLDSSKVLYFKPGFIESINIKGSRGLTHIDFARFLAFLANYKHENNINKVAAGIDGDTEKFYESYITAVVDDRDSSRFGKFSSMFPGDCLTTRMEHLKETIEGLDFQTTTYNSIIFLDIDFFGLVYHVIFEGKEIDLTNKDELKEKLRKNAEKFKKDKDHAKNPSAITRVRNRIKNSISIYRKYLK